MINLILADKISRYAEASKSDKPQNEQKSVIVDRYGNAFSNKWNEQSALEALTVSPEHFKQFDEKLLKNPGFAEKCLNVAPEVYWMPNFPKTSRYELLWLLRAMDFKIDRTVITELPVVLKDDFRVIQKWMKLNYLDAIQEYFITDDNIHECRLRDIHSDTFDLSLCNYLNTATETFYHSLIDQVYFSDSLIIRRKEWSELLLRFSNYGDLSNRRLGLDIIFSKMEVDDLGDIADRLQDTRDDEENPDPDFLEIFLIATIKERTTINYKRFTKWFSKKLTTTDN